MAHQADELMKAVGTEVSLTGEAADYKIGAALVIEGDRPVFLEGLDFWPSELRGRRMKVCGLLRHRPAASAHGDGPIRAQRATGGKYWIESPAWEEAP